MERTTAETATKLPMKSEKISSTTARSDNRMGPFEDLRREIDRLFGDFHLSIPSALWPFALRPRAVSAAKGRWRRRWTLSKEPKSPEEDRRQDRAMARMIASSRHSAH